MATRPDGSLINSGYLDRPVRPEALVRAQQIGADIRALAEGAARALLDSAIATSLPASKLEAFLRGEIDRRGNPTAKGVLAPVEQEARSHWFKMHDYRRSLRRLQADPDLPLRDEWIERTRDNADWHRRRLVELLHQRRQIRADLIAAADREFDAANRIAEAAE